MVFHHFKHRGKGERLVSLRAHLRPIGGSSALSAAATARLHEAGCISQAIVS
jgi:hypothetical protein